MEPDIDKMDLDAIEAEIRERWNATLDVEQHGKGKKARFTYELWRTEGVFASLGPTLKTELSAARAALKFLRERKG